MSPPAVDHYEEKDDIVAKDELSAMDKNNIEVNLSGNRLEIKGEKEQEEEVQQFPMWPEECAIMKRATLVLLPGLDGTEIFFRPLLAVLPKWIKPVVVTYPMSGANGYSDLLEVVEAAVEGSRELYVLGWSFSGPLALMLAVKDPTRIRGVILCASFVRPPLPALSWLRFAFFSPVVYLVRLARRVPVFLANESKDLLWRDMATTWDRVPTRILAARARAILALDARECLRECPRPVLYLGQFERQNSP